MKNHIPPFGEFINEATLTSKLSMREKQLSGELAQVIFSYKNLKKEEKLNALNSLIERVESGDLSESSDVNEAAPIINLGNARTLSHKILNKLVDMSLIPVRKKSEDLVSTVADVLMNAKLESVNEAEQIKIGTFVRYKKDKDFTGGKVLSIKGSNVEIHNWNGSTTELPLKDLEYVKSWNESVNEAWSNTDTDKAADLINKEIGVNPGYFFIGDEDLIKQFDKLWTEKKYKVALNLLMDIENLKDLKDFIKQNESKINEAAAKIKPFDSVKPGDKAEVLGDTAKWSVIDKAKGKDYAKVLKKYDNSGVVSDMMKNHTDHGLTKKEFEEMPFIAIKSPRGETEVYTYEIDAAFVPA